MLFGSMLISSGTYAITVGAGGAGGNPNSYSYGPGLSNSITGTAVIYTKGKNVHGDGGYVIGTPNTGNGGSTFRAGGSGIVIIRCEAVLSKT